MEAIHPEEYKILVVDDVMSNVLLLRILLTKEKYQVCTARNGKECIAQALAEKPDVILLDVMMPEMDGFQTAEALKGDAATENIPFIFLTALNTPSDLVHGFQVGASDFLTKPFNKEELLMRVGQQVKLVAARRVIEKQNEDLKAIISNRDKLYSVIAHDLRSPMASMRMVLNLCVNALSPEMIGEDMYSLLDKANKESEDTHDLLDNLLKWTKSQTGRLNVAYQNFDLCDVLPGVVDIYGMIAETKKITLNLAMAKPRMVVRADNDMLKTVVRNFITNAIKFSPEGNSIDIAADADEQFAYITVTDHGIGIPADRIEHIFRSGKTTYGTGGEEGSGLGLMLCQDFAQKNGGDVWVESEEGKGSTFGMKVPVGEA